MKKLIPTVLLMLSLTAITPVKAETTSQEIINGMNDFAFNMYHAMAKPDSNMVFSPFSVSFLLELLVNGAAGETQLQLINLLSLSNDKNTGNLISELNQINTQLLSANPGLAIANSLWSDSEFIYQPGYLASLDKLKNKSFYIADFKNKSNEERTKMNSWVETNTKGYITELFPSGSISPLTKLVLINAIYYKGKWSMPFEPFMIRPELFSTSTSQQSNVPMMHNSSQGYGYSEDDQVQMLMMNYKDSSLMMAIILPKSKDGLMQTQQTLNSAQWNKLLSSTSTYTGSEIIVSLPKFKLASTFAQEMISSLNKLGMKDAFNPSAANFSHLASLKDSNLYASTIIQKAIIEVDESGTVAAAATGLAMAPTSAISRMEPRKIYFNANHPFIFVLYDRISNLILFIGNVSAPSSE